MTDNYEYLFTNIKTSAIITNLYLIFRSGDVWPVSECRTTGMSTDWIDIRATLPSDG